MRATAKAQRTAAIAILNLIPKPIARVYFPSSASARNATKDAEVDQKRGQTYSRDDAELESMIAGVERILDVFSDPYLNRHLVFAVMERVVVALLPELAEGKSVAELLADRGVDINGDDGGDDLSNLFNGSGVEDQRQQE